MANIHTTPWEITQKVVWADSQFLPKSDFFSMNNEDNICQSVILIHSNKPSLVNTKLNVNLEKWLRSMLNFHF